MNPAISSAATAYLAPKVFGKFRFSWLLYGAAAYVGIRYLNKRGILPKQTDAALNLIDKGVDLAKQQVGIGKSDVQTNDQKTLNY